MFHLFSIPYKLQRSSQELKWGRARLWSVRSEEQLHITEMRKSCLGPVGMWDQGLRACIHKTGCLSWHTKTKAQAARGASDDDTRESSSLTLQHFSKICLISTPLNAMCQLSFPLLLRCIQESAHLEGAILKACLPGHQSSNPKVSGCHGPPFFNTLNYDYLFIRLLPNWGQRKRQVLLESTLLHPWIPNSSSVCHMWGLGKQLLLNSAHTRGQGRDLENGGISWFKYSSRVLLLSVFF